MYHIPNFVSDLTHIEVVHFGKINIVTILSSYQEVYIYELLFFQKISSPERDKILDVQR
jgi:hypothetical protein